MSLPRFDEAISKAASKRTKSACEEGAGEFEHLFVILRCRGVAKADAVG